jgi:hypothetical protein
MTSTSVTTLADRARVLGEQHHAVCTGGGSADLLGALGVTGPVPRAASGEYTSCRHLHCQGDGTCGCGCETGSCFDQTGPEQAAAVEAYCNALEGKADPGPRPRSLAEVIEAARGANCGECWAEPGAPCTVQPPLLADPDVPSQPADGIHVARIARAARRGLVSGAEVVAVLGALPRFSTATLVHGQAPGARRYTVTAPRLALVTGEPCRHVAALLGVGFTGEDAAAILGRPAFSPPAACLHASLLGVVPSVALAGPRAALGALEASGRRAPRPRHLRVVGGTS